jgi:thioredoxin-dependent peroxiredoxin
MAQLSEGDEAPDFELDSDGGAKVRLSSLRGSNVVLFFYPKDDTPGCTLEARGFSTAAPRFTAAGVKVFGLSRDTVAKHCRFRDKHGLTVPLLSDPDLEAHRAFGVWGEKMMYGRKVEGTVRSTFVIGPDGRVRAAFRGVKVDGHVEKVLATVTSDATPIAPVVAATTSEPAAKKPAAKKPAAKKPAAKKPAAKKPAAKKA